MRNEGQLNALGIRHRAFVHDSRPPIVQTRLLNIPAVCEICGRDLEPHLLIVVRATFTQVPMPQLKAKHLSHGR